LIAAGYVRVMKSGTPTILAAMVIAASAGYYSDGLLALRARAIAPVPRSHAAVHVPQHCDIKGNISINTGERIYHVPGQKYYAATRISPQYGERWFCSEAEAQAAGWRKARR
jgi:hypothetical protein